MDAGNAIGVDVAVSLRTTSEVWMIGSVEACDVVSIAYGDGTSRCDDNGDAVCAGGIGIPATVAAAVSIYAALISRNSSSSSCTACVTCAKGGGFVE